MSTTPTQIISGAQTVVQLANTAKSLFVLAGEFIDWNNTNDPGWNTLQGTPVVPPMNASTKIIDTTDVQPGDVSNAIGSLNNFITWWGTNGANLEKIAKPIV